MTTTLELDDVTVRRGGETVLDGVDAGFTGGEMTGVVGPNGAGKTTLLRTVTGVHDTDSGTVRVGGRSLDAMPSRVRARHVSYLPQESGIPFDYTAREVVAMGRYPHTRGRPTDDDAVDEALATTATEEFADRAVSTLSSGQRRRVLLARTLAQRTPVVLLDEPTSAMDIRHASAVLDTVAELVRGEDRTVVAVLHELETALRLCDRVVMLDGGDVVAAGRPEDVITEERVEAVYGRAVAIGRDATTGHPTVTVRSGDADPSRRAADPMLSKED